MKIAYLHGLESNIDQKDPKIIFLNNNFDEVYTPSINYKDKGTFSRLFSKIKSFKPDLIVGSSMGGYFAYLIGSKLGIETVLFNPAVVSRSFEPVVDDSKLKGTKHNVHLGKSDNVINGEQVMRYFGHAGSGSFYYTPYKGGHRVPEDTFINAIKDATGIKEQESTQIYKKRKFIMKYIRTINEEFENINEEKLKEDLSENKESPQWGGPEYKKLNGAFSRLKVNIDIQHYDNSGGFMSTYDNISQDELQVIANKVGRKLGMEFKVGEPIKSQESGYYIDINFKTLH
jgi:hypothetical protein